MGRAPLPPRALAARHRLERLRLEARRRPAPLIHWGYGGSVCHPITQVQPFARESDEPVSVLMIRTRSDFPGASVPARAESRDGTTWTPIPPGVFTTGKYALILRALRATD